MVIYTLIIILLVFLSIFVSCQNFQNIFNPINKLIQDTTGDITPIGIVTDMYCSAVTIPPALIIAIAPTSKAIAGKTYIVELYEKGIPRAQTTISWNQPQINVNDPVDVHFLLSSEEFHAYVHKDITGIFSIKITEGQSTINNHTECTSNTDRHIVTVVTTWETLYSWGVTAEDLEKVIGERSPGYGSILEYCHVKQKDSSTIIKALQKLVDKYQ